MFNRVTKSLVCFFILTTAFGCVAIDDGFKNVLSYLIVYPDFDLSLKRYGESHQLYSQHFDGEEVSQRDYYKFKLRVESFYNWRRKFPSLSHKDKIPRVIHQIWLGSPVPEKYQKFMETWQGWNGWTYILWTDEEVKNLHLYNQALYDEAENFGEKADILRYELLYQFGGLYIDTDFVCLKPAFFNFAHEQYSFYIAIEPLEHGLLSCCNALMASAPRHPMMKKMIYHLKEQAQQYPNDSPIVRTGPIYLSKMISLYLDLLEDGMIFPPTFFYPINAAEIDLLYRNKRRFIRPETMAIHFWEGSWRDKK